MIHRKFKITLIASIKIKNKHIFQILLILSAISAISGDSNKKYDTTRQAREIGEIPAAKLTLAEWPAYNIMEPDGKFALNYTIILCFIIN